MTAATPRLLAAALAALAMAPAVAAAQSEQVSAEIKLFSYQPATLQVEPGTTVTWTNQDGIEHSVTSGEPGDPTDAFDSGFFTQGQTFSHTFTEPGTYPYFCRRHESMQGAVEVVPGS